MKHLTKIVFVNLVVLLHTNVFAAESHDETQAHRTGRRSHTTSIANKWAAKFLVLAATEDCLGKEPKIFEEAAQTLLRDHRLNSLPYLHAAETSLQEIQALGEGDWKFLIYWEMDDFLRGDAEDLNIKNVSRYPVEGKATTQAQILARAIGYLARAYWRLAIGLTRGSVLQPWENAHCYKVISCEDFKKISSTISSAEKKKIMKHIFFTFLTIFKQLGEREIARIDAERDNSVCSCCDSD